MHLVSTATASGLEQHLEAYIMEDSMIETLGCWGSDTFLYVSYIKIPRQELASYTRLSKLTIIWKVLIVHSESPF